MFDPFPMELSIFKEVKICCNIVLNISYEMSLLINVNETYFYSEIWVKCELLNLLFRFFISLKMK